jgi:hypothetical protein
MSNNRDDRLLNTMRNLLAQGIDGEEALIEKASEVIGGGDLARKAASAVYDRNFKIFTAN